MKTANVLCATFLLLLGVFCGLSTIVQARPIIAISFPPVKDQAQRDFSITQLSRMNVTHIRFAENWKNREPERGEFKWRPLQSRIESMYANGFKILLTIQIDGPEWACASRNSKSCIFNDWQDIEPYLEELLARFGDKLDAIQFGNEWDHQFKGSAEQYLAYQNAFYGLVKRERPDLTVVLGGITSRAMLFKTLCLEDTSLDISQMQVHAGIDLSKLLHEDICIRKRADYIADRRDIQMVMASARYDIADIHLYDIPQFWPRFVYDFKQMTSKPIYVSEFGGPNPQIEPLDPDYQATRLSQYLKSVSDLPILRAYYFKLTDSLTAYHARSGLFDQQGNEKPALEVFLNR